VTSTRSKLHFTSFNDPQLDHGRIGLQVLEEDYAPPSLPLIRNGHAAQLVGFNSFGEHSADIIRAAATGDLATAVVWGPIAGYFARRDHLPVQLHPVSPSVDSSGVPFTFTISFGVHQNDPALRAQIDQALHGLQPQITAILTRYNIPLIPAGKEER
jgi:mxaJ protein